MTFGELMETIEAAGSSVRNLIDFFRLKGGRE